MVKVLKDGKLVDEGDVVKKDELLTESPKDGDVVGPGVVVTPLPNSESNPVGAVGPLEGKDNSGLEAKDALLDSKAALVNSPGRLSESNKELRDKLREEFKNETDEEIDKRVLRKIESEGRAAADRDLPEARDLQHVGPNEPENPDKTAVREDGTVTTVHKPELTAVMLHGTKVLVTDEQWAKYNELLNQLNELAGDTPHGDIPLGDPYYAKKAELDAFVARLKR